jgi:hypothetical protein
MEEAAVGDNPGEAPLRPAIWDQMTGIARKNWKQRQKKKPKQ